MGKVKTSKVWNYFTKIDNGLAKCSVCSKQLSIKSGSTSNLSRHLSSKHSVTKDDDDQIEYKNDNMMGLSTSLMDNDVESQDIEMQSSIKVLHTPKTNSSRKKTSCAWTFFTQVEKGKVRCSLCEKILSMKSSSSFNLFRHLRSKHDFVIESQPLEMIEEVLIPSSNPVATTESVPQSKVNVSVECDQKKPLPKQTNAITNLLFKTLIKESIPLDIVESTHFKQFVQSLKSGYQIPTARILSNTVLTNNYTMTKEFICKSLKLCTSLCLTMESWTSMTNDNYISTTCHFIDDDWNFVSHMLDCCIYKNEFSPEYLTKEVERITNEWNIEDRIEAVVTANIPFIVSAIEAGPWKHLPCFVHTLNSIVTCALDEVQILQHKIQNIVYFFRKTSDAEELLSSMQKQLNKPVLKLKLNSTTLWTSTYDMFMRILEVQEPLTSIMVLNFSDVEHLTSEEFNIVQQCCELLEVFKDVALEMEGDKYVSCTKITLLSKGLVKFCENYLNNSNDLTDAVVRLGNSLLSLLKEHFSNLECNKLFAEATFLDPRFKRHGFSETSNFENTKKNIIQEMIALNEDKVEALKEFCSFGTSKSSKLWHDFDNNVSELIGTSNPNAKIASSVEMKNYIEEPLLLRTNDPFTWWKERKSMFPRLTNVARRKLCVVGTSVPSESIFSKEGQMKASKRLGLTGDNVPQLVFLNANL